MSERGPRGPEISSETRELLRTPEQVFDSDAEQAERQSREVLDRLMRKGEISRTSGNAELETIEIGRNSAPRIQIAWPSGKNYFLLNLEPITEGKGAEKGVFGYTGSYGTAAKGRNGYKFSEKVSLEELFAVPNDLTLIVHPTINRWAIEIGVDPATAAAFGKDVRNMYMGMGFLLLGQEWMHVGMHEAGHLPSNPDENLAWKTANEKYAAIHKPIKQEIIAGKHTGRFGLLKKPESRYYGETPRLGDIAKYGLVSHARANNAKVPAQWNQEQIMYDFQKIISAADEAYEYFIGR
ncbi:MAG: hypothetical protein AAB729_04635 [Patescibacteria group bacterium]